MVVEPIVEDIDVGTGKDQLCITEVHTAIPQRGLPLLGIEGDFRQIYVPPINGPSIAIAHAPNAVLHTQ